MLCYQSWHEMNQDLTPVMLPILTWEKTWVESSSNIWLVTWHMTKQNKSHIFNIKIGWLLFLFRQSTLCIVSKIFICEMELKLFKSRKTN